MPGAARDQYVTNNTAQVTVATGTGEQSEARRGKRGRRQEEGQKKGGKEEEKRRVEGSLVGKRGRRKRRKG